MKIFQIITCLVILFNFSNINAENKTQDPKIKVFSWVTDLSVLATPGLYNNTKNNTLSDITNEEKNQELLINLQVNTPYTYAWNGGFRLGEYIFFDNEHQRKIYGTTLEFIFGKNVFFKSRAGIQIFSAIGLSIAYAKNITRARPSLSFGCKLPIRIYNSYITPVVEYSINTIASFDTLLLIGMGVSY